MIGVGKNDFCAEFFEGFLREAFDGGLRAHGHEEGSLDGAVRRGEAATARAGGIGLCYFKGEIHLRLHTREQDGQGCLSCFSVSGEDEGQTYAANHIRGPNAEGDSERLGALQFFWVYSGESNGYENESPKRKNVEGLAKCHEPLCGFFRNQNGEVGSQG